MVDGSTTLLREAMSNAAEYLDNLEREMVTRNVDMLVGEMAPPSVVADRLRAALQSQPTGETWQSLSCGAQFDLAQRIAANVGYVLAPEPAHPDSPHAPSPSPDRLSADRKEYAKDWVRQIVEAGADENIAQQAVALAGLNGLFDHLNFSRQPEASEPVASDDGEKRRFIELMVGPTDAGKVEVWKSLAEEFAKKLDETETQLAALRASPVLPDREAWQPIETAPKDGSEIDLWLAWYDGRGKRLTDCFWGTPQNFDDTAADKMWVRMEQDERCEIPAPVEQPPFVRRDGVTVWWKVTHWVPLPAPPTPGAPR